LEDLSEWIPGFFLAVVHITDIHASAEASTKAHWL
jgi:hypothetical protein